MRKVSRRIRGESTRFDSSRLTKISEKHLHGYGRVVSFSLFGDNPKYFANLEELNLSYRKFFPEWGLRFYVAEDVNVRWTDRLTEIGAEVIRMSATGIDESYMFWRFLATEDESLERVLVRDADSLALARDSRFVGEWEASGKLFHVIRDHLYHSSRVMGGIWGAVPQDKLVTQHFRHLYRVRNSWGRDQIFLSRFVYPDMRRSLLVHDVIHRFEDEEIIKSPIDAESYEFIGEFSFPLHEREMSRAQYKELWTRYLEADFEEPLKPDWALRWRLRGEETSGLELMRSLRKEGWAVNMSKVKRLWAEENQLPS